MKTFLKIFACWACSLVCTTMLSAQTPTQIIIANGGVFGSANFVTVAYYTLANTTYHVIDSFPASSVQHVLIHERHAFVCADSFVVKYNLDNYQREAIVLVKGARQSAVYQDKLLISKGYGAVGDYLEVRRISDLGLEYSVPGIAGECEGIVVQNDSAYIAVPIGFGAPTGKIAVVSLQSHLLDHEIDLDTNGRIIKNLYLHHGTIYSVNQIAYTSGYGIVSSYDITTGNLAHHRVDLPTSQGCGIFNGKLYAAFGGGIGGWDLTTQQLVDTNVVPGYWAGMAADTVNQQFYVTETDYATFGNMLAYNMSNQIQANVPIGVSPEALAVDYNIPTSAAPKINDEAGILAYPQPFGNRLSIDLRSLPYPAERVQILDLTGRVLISEAVNGNRITEVAPSALPAGTYLLRVQAHSQVWTSKVVKCGE